MGEIAVLTEDLTRTFGPIRAVDHLRLEVPAGIVFGFLGPNAAGKTTTIRLLLGLLEASKGRARVLGFDTGTESGEIRRRTGALLERSGLYERLSAEDNLEFYGRVFHMRARERKDRIRELLTHLGLWDRRKEITRNWSRGMKQKLAMARVLLHRPSLIFLDEPTAGLDPKASADLRSDLAGLVSREGVTVFLTTHNLTEAERLCARVGVINKGRLLALGHPDELRHGRGDARVEVTGRGFTSEILESVKRLPGIEEAVLDNGRLKARLEKGTRAAPLVALLVEAGVEVEEVKKGMATLEEVFLTLLKEERSA